MAIVTSVSTSLCRLDESEWARDVPGANLSPRRSLGKRREVLGGGTKPSLRKSLKKSRENQSIWTLSLKSSRSKRPIFPGLSI